jgi:predicted aminopeptidase
MLGLLRDAERCDAAALRCVRVVIITILGTVVTGCSLPYYWQAAAGHFDVVQRRVPIDAVLDDPAQPASIKDSLRRVVAMRQFAIDELGLPDNDSYVTYADLERPYVVWNVVAAGEFSVDAEQWCFLFIGCVSYRGYFSRDAAREFSATLKQRGLDTYVAGATAYSTLGYFSDPVLNTMLAGGESYVAGVLFHELAHQRFYLRGDSEINEAFATAVQQYGTALWLMRFGTEDDVAAYRRRLGRQEDFTTLVADQRTRLATLYASNASVDELRDGKAAAFAQMRTDYERNKAAWGGVTDYDAWFAQPLNNAQLASVTTYRRWLPALVWYIDAHGLDDFYTQMDALAQLDPAERERRLEQWLTVGTTRVFD